MQMDQDKLKAENTNLVAAFREKSRKHQQTQELYDRLKRKEMTAQTRSAAYESVDEVLGSVSRRQNHDLPAPLEHYQSIRRPQRQCDITQFPVDHNGVEQLHPQQRSGSNGSRHSEGRMPPPFRWPTGYGNQEANNGGSPTNKSTHVPANFSANHMPPPPLHHRARLGPLSNSASRLGMDGHRNIGGLMGSSQMQTPSHRQPFINGAGNSVNRPIGSGYGMSAGLKVGRQQGNGKCTKFKRYPKDLLILLQLLSMEGSLSPAKAVVSAAP